MYLSLLFSRLTLLQEIPPPSNVTLDIHNNSIDVYIIMTVIHLGGK